MILIVEIFFVEIEDYIEIKLYLILYIYIIFRFFFIKFSKIIISIKNNKQKLFF